MGSLNPGHERSTRSMHYHSADPACLGRLGQQHTCARLCTNIHVLCLVCRICDANLS